MKPILSMTGYATASRDVLYGSISIEIRSVNNRFLDVQFRLLDDLRRQERAMREMVITQLRRGKVE